MSELERMRGALECAKKARVGQVEEQLAILAETLVVADKTLLEVENAVTSLADALQPVVSLDAARTEAAKSCAISTESGPDPRPNLVPLAESVLARTESVNVLINRLQRTTVFLTAVRNCLEL